MGIYVKWLGHASFEIRTDDEIVYIDPSQGEYRDKADLILVTHSHYDHCDTSKIKEIRKEGTFIIAPNDCSLKIGGNVSQLQPGEKISMRKIIVEAVEAYNYKRFRSPGNPFHPKGFGVGYKIRIGYITIYHAGDTDFVPEMNSLNDIYLALLPSGGTYTMDNSEAAEASLAISPKYVIPMHRWDTDPEEFRREVEAKSKIEVVLLQPGEQFEINWSSSDQNTKIG